VNMTIHFHLVLRSRMHGAIPPLPQYVFMAWCSVKAHGKLYFTVYMSVNCTFTMFWFFTKYSPQLCYIILEFFYFQSLLLS